MCLWLLAPTISCTFTSFREEPLTEYMDESSMEAGEMDRERVDQSKSFFGSIIDSAGMCYEEKPLTQQGWKTKLLYGLLGLWLVTKLFGHFWVMRQKPR